MTDSTVDTTRTQTTSKVEPDGAAGYAKAWAALGNSIALALVAIGFEGTAQKILLGVIAVTGVVMVLGIPNRVKVTVSGPQTVITIDPNQLVLPINAEAGVPPEVLNPTIGQPGIDD